MRRCRASKTARLWTCRLCQQIEMLLPPLHPPPPTLPPSPYQSSPSSSSSSSSLFYLPYHLYLFLILLLLQLIFQLLLVHFLPQLHILQKADYAAFQLVLLSKKRKKRIDPVLPLKFRFKCTSACSAISGAIKAPSLHLNAS